MSGVGAGYGAAVPYQSIRELPVPVARIALGGRYFGREVDLQQAALLLDTYSAAGGNHLDTGGTALAERCIGAWLRVHGNRDGVVLAAAIAGPDADTGLARLNPAALRLDLGDCLDRLGTDHLDICYVQEDDPCRPIDELVDMLQALVDEGLTQAIACCQWSPQRQLAFNAMAQRQGRPGFVCQQLAGSSEVGFDWLSLPELELWQDRLQQDCYLAFRLRHAQPHELLQRWSANLAQSSTQSDRPALIDLLYHPRVLLVLDASAPGQLDRVWQAALSEPLYSP